MYNDDDLDAAVAAGAIQAEAAAALRNDPDVQYHYAAALARAGRPSDAIHVLDPVVEQKVAFREQENARKLMQELTGKK